MRRGSRALCGIAAAAAFLVAGVAPLSASEATIQPGIGIGKVRLGMTLARVKRALGSGYLADERKPGFLELEWDFGSWTVAFQQGRAVLVSTTEFAQRTSSGAGPGAAWPRVVHAYPGGRCTFSEGNDSLWRIEYLVAHRGGAQTLFTLRQIYNRQQARVRGYRVVEATVRKPYEPLPEFASGWPYRCAEGWARAVVPRLQHR